MNKYIVTHEHRFGTSIYFVKSGHYPSTEELIEHCGIDFEEDRGEFLCIGLVDNEDCITIPPKQSPVCPG